MRLPLVALNNEEMEPKTVKTFRGENFLQKFNFSNSPITIRGGVKA